MMGEMDRAAGIGISDDHLALRDTVRRWAAAHCPPAVTRAPLDAEDEVLPPFWTDLVERRWIGLPVAEESRGEGFGLAELAVVLEELGRVCAPGPFLPTALAAVVLDRFGGDTVRDTVRATVLPDLVSGRRVGAVGFGCAPIPAAPGPEGLVLDGACEAVLSGALADVLVLPVVAGGRADGRARGRPGDRAGDRADETWAVVDAVELDVAALASLDRTRRVARVRARRVTVPADRLLSCPPGPAGVDGVAAALLSAECVGVAAWCVERAAEHAVVREQFGRPIGQFQAVKHRCADMLCALEQARAAAWDASRGGGGDSDGDALAVAVAAALAPATAYRCAKDCIQVLGGIGFTWEHDAHVYLKRAAANRLLLGGPGPWRASAAELALRGARRDLGVALPPAAQRHRGEVRAFLDDLRSRDKAEWNRRIADSGYLVPHWPTPWGRDASPLEQLVIDDEFQRARVHRPHLAVGAWVLPTLIVHGSPEQQERLVPPTLRGEITWCQMFSEPGAGSDLASLATKATRVDGGWLVSGQKVWTTMAHVADWGICLARTDPTARRHEGIGCFLVDMRSEGIDVRPLRELTGAEMFNEVFLTDVFVPDDCVVGEPTAGWPAARTTLANERVSMGRGSSMGPGVEALLALVAEGPRDDPLVLDTLGAVVAATHSLAAMGVRMTLRALSGAAPDGAAPGSADASIRKLLGVELDQWVQEVGLDLLGRASATGEGEAERWIAGFLGNRSLSIAGGTSEIQRNVIAERLLGLPRDP
jgi:alkylation response protein AidB-like acyl-CoA dehydrogenase